MQKDLEEMWDRQVRRINMYKKQKILLNNDARSGHAALYRERLTKRQFGAAEIDGEIAETSIVLVITYLVAHIMITTKKDGSLRIFVDYRKIKAVASFNSFPVPHMDQSMDSFGEAMVFSTLAANPWY